MRKIMLPIALIACLTINNKTEAANQFENVLVKSEGFLSKGLSALKNKLSSANMEKALNEGKTAVKSAADKSAKFLGEHKKVIATGVGAGGIGFVSGAISNEAGNKSQSPNTTTKEKPVLSQTKNVPVKEVKAAESKLEPVSTFARTTSANKESNALKSNSSSQKEQASPNSKASVRGRGRSQSVTLD